MSDNDLGCWPYDMLEVVLNMRKTFDGWMEFLEEMDAIEHSKRGQDEFLDRLLPIVNSVSNVVAITGLMGACGRILEDTLDGYAKRRTNEKERDNVRP